MTWRFSSRVAATAALLAVTTGGACSGAPAPTSSVSSSTPARPDRTVPARPTACSLVTRDEMSAILGGDLGTPEGHEGLASTTCRYLPTSDASPISAQVTIEWRAGEAAMRAARVAQRAAERVTDASVSAPLDGLGDEALFMVDSILMIRQGATVITIDLTLQPDARAKGSAIARKLLDRIKV